MQAPSGTYLFAVIRQGFYFCLPASSSWPSYASITTQKIFVMPNMDDVWLPIMHSAMDTRSNANALKNEETLDPEESLEDMWRLVTVSNKR